MLKWDKRFLDLAQHISTWSKDMSTKVGAVITRNKRLVSVGYNGFPEKVLDLTERYEDRAVKYKMIVHAERNAILFAQQSLVGCTLYTYPFGPCSVCAGMIIQAGISRCVFPRMSEDLKKRWGPDIEMATKMFAEAGIEVFEME